jgi:hypothetical protein
MNLDCFKQSSKEMCSKWELTENIWGEVDGSEYFNKSQNAWLTYDFKQPERITKYEFRLF